MPVISEETFLALQDDNLQHYGVLGMKWGVRRNPDRAYSKAGKKLTRLDSKYQRKQKKASKWASKASKWQSRSITAWTFKKFKRWRASRTGGKAFQAQSRSNNALKKAYDWNKNMKEVFKGVKLNNLDKNVEDLGKKYSSYTLADLNSLDQKTQALLYQSMMFQRKAPSVGLM